MEDISAVSDAVAATLVAALIDAIDYRADQGECQDCLTLTPLKCPDHEYDDELARNYQVLLDRLTRRGEQPWTST